MISIILILIVIFLLGLGFGVLIWLVLRHLRKARIKGPAKEGAVAETPVFHWSYIMLPLAILLLSILLSAYFYHQLPGEVAYHFKREGSPDRWLSREIAIALALVLQLLLVLVAGGISWGMVKLGGSFQPPEQTKIKPERVLSLMGNMIALPQLIVCFAMLDIFSYNSYQIHIMPLWMFALIVMGLGGIVLSIFFIQAIRGLWIT